MFASQTIWRLPTIFLFTVILILVRFPSTDRAKCKPYSPASRERRIILPSTYFSKHDLSMQRERHLRLNLPLNTNSLSRVPRNIILEYVKIIFIVSLFFYNTQRNLCLLINDAMTHRRYRHYWSFFIIFHQRFFHI